MRPRIDHSGTTRKDLILSIAIALLLMGFLVFAFTYLGRKTTAGGRHGVIIDMSFTPAPERQVTLGRGGLHAREIDGEYLLTVRVGEGENASIHRIIVDPRVYAQHKVGDRYFFVLPPKAPDDPTPAPSP